MTTKTVLGIIGEKGAGKGTFVELLKKEAEAAGVTISVAKSSDILGETLDDWNLPKTRTNLQQLAIIMDKQYGIGSLSNAVRHHMEQCPDMIVIYEGMRWKSDVEMIRSFLNSNLIYITASAEVRFERTKRRGEKVGENEATFEQFMEEEKVATETSIKEIGKMADITIINDGSEEELKLKVKEVFERIK